MPAFNLAKAAMPVMAGRGGGAFVCVSAKAALEPFAGAAGYISAKAAVLAFVRALDAEYRDDSVRANAILPSIIDTPGQPRGHARLGLVEVGRARADRPRDPASW